MIVTVLIALFSIITLLVLHEFGHFVVAKYFGVKVDEFGIGYPPRLFAKKFGETVYSLNLLPFGAFVKIPGEGGEEKTVEDSHSFSQKPAWQRAFILLGGVVSFWLVAIVLLSIVFSLGVPQAISDDEPGPLVNPQVQILSVAADSPAEAVGIQGGDAIQKMVVGEEVFEIQTVKEVQEITDAYKGEEITLIIQRGKETTEVSLTPRITPPAGEGAMGVALVRTAEKTYPLWQAPLKGMEATWELTRAIVLGWAEILGGLVQGEGLPRGVQLVGPIGIGSLLTQAAQAGINYFLQFVAMLAVYLAIFNILPIPALDGGKLLFLAIEKVKGKPINYKIEQRVTTAFFAVLILLMVWVTIQDISRLF